MYGHCSKSYLRQNWKAIEFFKEFSISGLKAWWIWILWSAYPQIYNDKLNLKIIRVHRKEHFFSNEAPEEPCVNIEDNFKINIPLVKDTVVENSW